MKSSRLLTTGSVMTSSRPESGGRKTHHTYSMTILIHLWQKVKKDEAALVFELTNKFMSSVLSAPAVTSVSVEVNIMPHNSIKPIKCSPLRRRHNVQFSSEMTLAGLRRISGIKNEPVLTNDLSCCMLWPLGFGLATSILIILSPACKDRLQITARRVTVERLLEGATRYGW